MAHALLVDELVIAPREEDGFGIYWLRLDANGMSGVAIATEVPGNPGA